MNAPYEPVNTEHFLSRLLGKARTHGLAGALQDDRTWRRFLVRRLEHLRRYVATNLGFTDAVHRDQVERVLASLVDRSRMAPSVLREQALVTGLLELCQELLGGLPDHWDRRAVSTPRRFVLDRHRSISYVQSVRQRARLIADWCGRYPPPPPLTDRQAKEAADRYHRLVSPRRRYGEFVEWFRTTHPEAYGGLFTP
jgi:hypothetical protein